MMENSTRMIFYQILRKNKIHNKNSIIKVQIIMRLMKINELTKRKNKIIKNYTNVNNVMKIFFQSKEKITKKYAFKIKVYKFQKFKKFKNNK